MTDREEIEELKKENARLVRLLKGNNVTEIRYGECLTRNYELRKEILRLKENQ